MKAAAPAASDDVARKAEVDAHASNKSNPHGVTAAQVGALPLTGGTITSTYSTPLAIKTSGVGYGYIPFYTDKTDLNKRTAYFGFPGGNDNEANMAIKNEVNGGNLSLYTSGGGEVFIGPPVNASGNITINNSRPLINFKPSNDTGTSHIGDLYQDSKGNFKWAVGYVPGSGNFIVYDYGRNVSAMTINPQGEVYFSGNKAVTNGDYSNKSVILINVSDSAWTRAMSFVSPNKDNITWERTTSSSEAFKVFNDTAKQMLFRVLDSGAVQVKGNHEVWHAGNFNPNSKANYSGNKVYASGAWAGLRANASAGSNAEVDLEVNGVRRGLISVGDDIDIRKYAANGSTIESRLTLTSDGVKANNSDIWTNANNAASKAMHGYQRLASGVILQWVVSTPPTPGRNKVNFPIAFPNSVRSVVVTPRLFNAEMGSAVITDLTNTQAEVHLDYAGGATGGGRGYTLFAIGY
ncbi:hypothetical protein [Paenibacillus sp. J2TS4]|uniref:gp53-like domain-containing protein n=1 Tax=Paenibacillus sp. J2TS4 TaxID=2807194 RepID=UPI001BCD01A5|nr:hypothetical protein [Paenibacillus sp. J2TS4]